MKRQILKSFAALCAGVMTLCSTSFFVSCDRLDQLEQEITVVKNDLAAFKADVQAQLEALTRRVDALYTLTFQVSEGNELQYSFDGGKTWTGTKVILATQTDLKFKVSDKNELMYSEDGGSTWKNSGVTLAENCDNTFKFKTENAKVYFSSDNGKTWTDTGATIVEPCTNPKAELIDNGDSVTIKVGDASFTIAKPEEVVFEIKAGKLYFAPEASQTVNVKTTGIDDLTVIYAPKGWEAEINSDGKIEVTAPASDELPETDWFGDPIPGTGTAVTSGFVKVHACTVEGKCMVGKLSVEVSENQTILRVVGGKYTVTTTDVYTYGVYYGIATKDKYKEAAQQLIDAVNAAAQYDWEALNAWPTAALPDEDEYGVAPIVEGTVAELLGSEPEVGVEYVMFAIELGNAESYSIDDLVLAFYSPIKVTAVEDESKRTAYDNWITLTVQGADSYYALAVPSDYAESLEDFKSQMIDLEYGGLGVLLTENYEGAFYQITAGSNSYVGEGTPGKIGYLLVLPIDGRPLDQYTVADVVQFSFETSPLLDGGSVNAEAERVYEAKKYNYDTWQYEMMALDPYSEVAVKVTIPEETWKYFYFAWMSEEDYANALNGDNDLIVDFVISNPASYPISPSDMEPVIVNAKTMSPGETVYFVGFFVDENGKYGQAAKVKLTTEELERSEVMAEATTNLVDGVLKNTQTLEVTLTADMPVSKYKYVKTETSYYNEYEGKTDADMADILFFMSTSSYGGATEVLVSELVDGNKLIIEGHEYNTPYYLAILPYDADDKPGKSAIMLEYKCEYELPSVITDALVSEPEVLLTIPTFATEADHADYAEPHEYCFYKMVTDYGDYFYYNTFYTVTAEEGVEVLTYVVNDPTEIGEMTALQKASGLWGKTIGYGINEGAGKFDKSFNGDAVAALAPVVLVSWKDAAGNYYYKEVSFAEELKFMYDALLWDGTPAEGVATPEGKQWGFTVKTEGSNLPAGTPAVLDFGVSKPGAFVLGAETMPGTYTDVLSMMGGAVATVEPMDATRGFVTLQGLVGFDDDDEPIYGQMEKFCYYNLTETSCTFSSAMFFGYVPVATPTTVTFADSGIGGGPLSK